VEVITQQAAETRAWGDMLGRLVQSGDFIALHGDLGAGKTHFAQGVAQGLAVPDEYRVTSPTYTVLNIYPGRLSLYHFDLYRLSGAAEIVELGFEEYFYGAGVCLVEWAERLGSECPADHLAIAFSYAGEEQRILHFTAVGERSETLLQQLAQIEKSFDPIANSC
jgi:tRNA threonylcarbamoyladenosine biosynthesis protein TsaE